MLGWVCSGCGSGIHPLLLRCPVCGPQVAVAPPVEAGACLHPADGILVRVDGQDVRSVCGGCGSSWPVTSGTGIAPNARVLA